MRFRLILSSMSASAAVITKTSFLISRKLLELASNFTIYHNLAHNSLYSPTGNDVTIYFRSAANRTNVFILSHVRVDNGSADSENF